MTIFEYHARADEIRLFVPAVKISACYSTGAPASRMAPRVRARDLFIYRKVSYPPDDEEFLEGV